MASWNDRTILYQNLSSSYCHPWILKITVLLLILSLNHVIGSKIIHVRHCSHEMRPRHITLAVGHDPSSEMIISFASTISNLPAPIAGVIVATNPKHLLLNSNRQVRGNSNSSSDNMDVNDDDDVLLFLEDHNHGSPTCYNVSVGDPQYANVNNNRYYSPYYHHITVTNMRPSTVYYYKLLLHTRMESFHPYFQYLTRPKHEALSSQTIFTKSNLLQLLRDADLTTRLDEGKEIFTTGTSSIRGISNDEFFNDNEDESGHKHRHLIAWDPYDSSQKDCPDPDATRSFKTAPPNGVNMIDNNDDVENDDSTVTDNHEQQKSIKIAVVGDIGQFPHSVETMMHMNGLKDELDMILLVGDIAYTELDHRRWDTFMDMLDDYGDLMHKVPMMIVPGNHDIDKLRYDTAIFLAYEHRFRMPRIQEPILLPYHGNDSNTSLNMDIPPYPLDYEYGNAYYSYPYGSAYFIMISAYSSMEPDSLQYDWIVKTLESVNRDQYPWLIIVLHTPMYNTFGLHHHDEQIIAAKKHLEPLIVQYRANFVFTGHIHAYLRTANVVYDVVNNTGPIHITVGAGGRKCDAPFTQVEPEEWVEVRDATYYGYGTLTIINNTHSIWEWIHNGNFSDKHPDHNEIFHSDITVPPGPDTDMIYVHNQYYL